VEIGGERLTASSYISWTDTAIRAVLPYNVADGMVYLITESGRSEALIFANRQTTPVPVKHNSQTTIPVIEAVQKNGASVGTLITVTGTNFGTLRGVSQVLFTAAESDKNQERRLIRCSEFDADYHFWSDNEVQVRIPDGAVSGNMYVQTPRGKSEGYAYTVANGPGSKTYTDMRTYSVNVSANVAEAEAEANATLTLFIPLPPSTASQHSVQILSSKPEPSLCGYMNTLVHQVTLNEASGKKLTFSHDFVISVYGIQSRIQSAQVKPYSAAVQKLYTNYLKANALIPADDERITELAASIVKKEKKLYQISDTIGCMSQANVDFLLRHHPQIPQQKVEINPNSITPISFDKSEGKRKAIKQKYHLPLDKKIFVYGGNLGKPQGLDFLLETIQDTKNEDVYFLIVGNGTEYHRIKIWFEQQKPQNAMLLSSLPKDDYDHLLSSCDVGLIFLDKRFTIPNFPSRLLSYLEMELPVIATTDPHTDIGDIIEEAQCGYKVLSGDLKQMQQTIDKLLASDIEMLGRNAKTLLLNAYTVDVSYNLINRAFLERP